MVEKSCKKGYKLKLYIESMLYVILVFLVIFLNIYGNIYIRMLPILFILGIIGKTVYDKPIITSIYGFLVSVVLMKLHGGYTTDQNIYFSIYNMVSISLGEILGILIYIIMGKQNLKCDDINKDNRKINENESENEEEKDKNNKNIHKKELVFTCIAIIIISIALQTYANGNIIEYNDKKSKILSYVKSNYLNNLNIQSINDKKSMYSKGTYIIFLNDNIGEEYKFAIDKQNNVIDGYKSTYEDLSSFVINSFNDFLNSHDLINNIYQNNYENYIINIENSNSKWKIIYEKNAHMLDDDTLIQISKEISDILNEIKEFEYYSYINEFDITIISEELKNIKYNYVQASIYTNEFNEDYEYIYNKLNEEYIK